MTIEQDLQSPPTCPDRDMPEDASRADPEPTPDTDSKLSPFTRLVLRILKVIAGALLLAAALVGFVLPVLPGFVFAFLGLGLLADEVPIIKRFHRRILFYLKRLIRSRHRWLRRRRARRSSDRT